MISNPARSARARFDCVETVHRRRATAHATSRREVTRVAEMSRPAVREITIERDDDVRLVEVIDGVHVAAERDPQALAHVVAIHRLPLMPLDSRILREEL